jgi:hypothetical protein
MFKLFLFSVILTLVSGEKNLCYGAADCRYILSPLSKSSHRFNAPIIGIHSIRRTAISSKRMFQIMRNEDNSFEFIPLRRNSWKKFTNFSAAESSYAPDGAPILFGYENANPNDNYPKNLTDRIRFMFNIPLKNTSPMVPQIIWHFFGISIDPKTKTMHIPSVVTI